MGVLPTRGLVGLQGKHAGAPIYFRNLKIKKTESGEPCPTPAQAGESE